METANIVIIAVALVISGLTFYLGRMTSSNKAGREYGAITERLESIDKTMSRIECGFKDDFKRLEGRIDEQSKRLEYLGNETTKASESAKSAHNRIDEMRPH